MLQRTARTSLATSASALSTLALTLLPVALFAQPPDISVTQLLFEPVPLVAGVPVSERALISFNTAQSEVPVAVVQEFNYSDAERVQMRADIERYIASIGDAEASEGPYADQLREDLFATGELYRKLEDYDNALKLYERTLNVSRINHGLEGLDQVEVLQAMADTYVAMDKLTEADAMMDSAYNLQLKAFGAGTTGLVPAERRLGDWNTQAFMQRSSILVNIPRMNVQQFLTDPRNFIDNSNDMRDTPVFKLYQARGNYLNAIRTLVEARDFKHPELMELERKLLTNFLLSTHRENIVYEPDFYLTRKKTKTASRLDQNTIELMNSEDYDLGRESHKRRMAYLVADEKRTAPQLVTAMLEEADWDLLFSHKTEGADKYNAAYKFFNENPGIIDNAREVIYPAVPVVLPTYLPAPNSREKLGIAADAKVNFFGYIDVSFALTKFGKARKIKQLGTGGEITRNMEIRLNEYIRRLQFRPRYKGTEVDTDPMTLRYYIGL